MKEEILLVEVEELFPLAEHYLEIMCGLQRRGKGAEKSRERAMKIRQSCFAGLQMPFLLTRFAGEEIEAEGFNFGGVRIACSSLGRINREHILAGYAVLMHSPMPDISHLPVSQMYLADSWETCLVDAGRDYLREKLLERETELLQRELYITDTLAPGMAGMPSESVSSFFSFIDGCKVGVELLQSGMMKPVKSFVGIYLLLDRAEVVRSANCGECVSHGKNCAYCKNYALRHFGGDFIDRGVQLADRSLLGQWLA